MRVVAVGHLAQNSLAQGCGPGTRGGIEGAAAAGDGRAGLGLAAVGALAHYQSGSGVDRSETVPDAVRSPSIQCLAISLKYRLLRAAHLVSSYLMLQVVRRMT